MELKDVFRNAQLGLDKGGVCRHIHDLVREMATALGFEAAGTHTGNWTQGDSTGRHAVAHYRDPVSGKFYMQNYATIINTGQKTLQGAVDISTRILSPLSTTSSIESAPGRVHLYQPRIARWVKDQIEGRVTAKDAAPVTLDIGNITQSVTVQGQAGPVKVTGFHINHEDDRYDEDGYNDGTQLTAIGFSIDQSLKQKFESKSSTLTEVAAGVTAYAGGTRFKTRRLEVPSDQVPNTGNPGDPKDWIRDSMYLGVEAMGHARFVDNSVTLYGEGKIHSSDFDPTQLDTPYGSGTDPYTEATLGIRFGKPDAPLSARIERSVELSKESNNSGNAQLNTKSDKLKFELYLTNDSSSSGSSPPPQTYIKANATLYAFGGTDAFDAIGIDAQLEAGAKLGDSTRVYIRADGYRTLDNQSRDPFYNVPASYRAQVAIIQELSDRARLEFTGGYQKGSSVGISDLSDSPSAGFGSSEEGEWFVNVGISFTLGSSRRN